MPRVSILESRSFPVSMLALWISLASLLVGTVFADEPATNSTGGLTPPGVFAGQPVTGGGAPNGNCTVA
jgi:hypothetical protein